MKPKMKCSFPTMYLQRHVFFFWCGGVFKPPKNQLGEPAQEDCGAHPWPSELRFAWQDLWFGGPGWVKGGVGLEGWTWGRVGLLYPSSERSLTSHRNGKGTSSSMVPLGGYGSSQEDLLFSLRVAESWGINWQTCRGDAVEASW